MYGICTLANDHVFDQVIALINSIEVMMGPDFPVCIYPYDDRLERLTAAIADRPNVTIYDDQTSIDFWDKQAQRIWDVHPTARTTWEMPEGYYRMGTHRRFCAFDGPFDRFVYMDADTLLMDSIWPIFELLEKYDWYVYDFQHRDISHVYDQNSAQLHQVFSADRIEQEIFCSGFYGAHRQAFKPEQLDQFWENLRDGEAAILYSMAPDQTILNYWVMRAELKIYNAALELSRTDRTGCCVTSPHFEIRDNIAYDRDKRLTYLHYIGLPSGLFKQICAGENIACDYRDLFLYYRYRHEPENQPHFSGPPKTLETETPSLKERVLRRLQMIR